MGVVQVTLNQVISALRHSLHSIDIRAVVRRSDSGWQPVLTGIRVSARPVEDVIRRHADLEVKFGGRQIEAFRVLFQALPFTEAEGTFGEIAQGRLTVEGESISLSSKVLSGELRGRVERYHELMRPWDDEAWPGVCFSLGDRSPLYDQPEAVAAIRGNLGLRSVEDLVSAFLEVKGLSSRRLDLFIFVEIPGKIERVLAAGPNVGIEVIAERNLRGLHVHLSRGDSTGVFPYEDTKLALKEVEQEGTFSLFRADARWKNSVHKDDLISCVLTHESLPELDEVRESLKRLMPLEEKNPLLECFKLFERQQATSKRKTKTRPQDEFQRSVTWLLNLAGFQAINLEREDTIYDPETRVKRATVDILAYHRERKIVLLGACTLNVPKNEDYDNLLHTAEILRRLFSEGSPVRLVPVLFSGQENVSVFRGEAAGHGLKTLNTHQLVILRTLIEKGEEERFLQFLDSALDTELRERSEWEAR